MRRREAGGGVTGGGRFPRVPGSCPLPPRGYDGVTRAQRQGLDNVWGASDRRVLLMRKKGVPWVESWRCPSQSNYLAKNVRFCAETTWSCFQSKTHNSHLGKLRFLLLSNEGN